MHHEYHGWRQFFGEAQFLRTRTGIVDNPAAAVNPGPGQPGVIIPGYAPSNTFRATNSLDLPLYAQSSGVQLGYDKDGVGGNDFLPARNATGQVIVAARIPNAAANGLAVVPVLGRRDGLQRQPALGPQLRTAGRSGDAHALPRRLRPHALPGRRAAVRGAASRATCSAATTGTTPSAACMP